MSTENLIQLQRVAKSFGVRTLFSDVTFSVNEGEHIGVVGSNGAGKTTLFKIIAGEEDLNAGEVTRSRKLRLGYLSQHDDVLPHETIEEFIAKGAVLPLWELKALGRGLGLSEAHYARHWSSLSGGYRMRAKLLRLLGTRPNLMLLDEPTNYLDIETLMVLEKFLQGFEGALLLISHDREFLRRITDHTLEIEGGDATKFNGDIDAYFDQKELLRSQLAARALSLDEKRNEVLAFVARFGAKATKASQVQSRLKSLDKMESIEIKPLPVAAHIRIPAPARTNKTVLKLSNVNLGYGDHVVINKLNLELASKDHLAVVGLNGAGKTTLLKALAGRLAPLSGSIEQGSLTTFAYFAQHVAEELLPDDTVIDSLQRKAHPSVLPQQILDLAGSLLFSGDDARKTVRILSGGERSRVALGQVLLQKASCLLLDEPTNHLDFQTVEALTQALASYEGAIVTVAHDRGFIRRVGTKILEIHLGQAAMYPGTYDDYIWSLERGAYACLQSAMSGPETIVTGNSESQVEKPRSANFEYRERKKSLARRFKQLETLIANLDERLAQSQKLLTTYNCDIARGDVPDVGQLVRKMSSLQGEIETMEQSWLEAVDERESIAKQLEEFST